MIPKLTTNKLFAASVAIYIIGIASSFIFFSLGFKNEDTPFIALILMIAFGVNIAGLIFSFSERKIDKRKGAIGMIGNLFFVLLFLSLALYAIAPIGK
jgi:hypothetical protein